MEHSFMYSVAADATRTFNDVVTLDVTKVPKSCRIHVGDHYLKLGQPKSRMPLVWDFDDHPKFLEFLGYWLRKGYYDKFAVSISGGKDVPDLIPVLDYIAELFTCHYKVRADKVAKIDSAMLKYVMMGLGFEKKRKKQIASLPTWIRDLSDQCKKYFFRGYLTASVKFLAECITFKNVEVISTHQMLHELFGDNTHYWITQTEVILPKESMQRFSEGIGFLSAQKMLELEQMIFTYKL